MADLLEMLYQRRSIRKYTGASIPDELLEQVIKTGLASETSRNRRSWQFIVVRDKAMLAKMAHFRQHSALMLEGADAAVVVLGDEEKSDVWTEDCSIAMAHMHLMADQLGLGSCWIHRAREEFDSPEGKQILKDLGIEGDYEGIDHLVLGYPSKDIPSPLPRKADYVRWAE